MIVYISGAYSNGDREENVARARRVAIELLKRGLTPLCPHTHYHNFDHEGVDYDAIIRADVELLLRCDAVLMLPGWQTSNGAKIEHKRAIEEGIPVFYGVEEILKALRDGVSGVSDKLQ